MEQEPAKIIYFIPEEKPYDEEMRQRHFADVVNVVKRLREHLDLDCSIIDNWGDLMHRLQISGNEHLLIVFRWSFVQRRGLCIDEVLSSLNSLISMVSGDKTVNTAIIANRNTNSSEFPMPKNLFSLLRKHRVLGIVPGMNFYNIEHTVLAYRTLSKGISHWPKIVTDELNQTLKTVYSTRVKATPRQEEIKLLIERGMSNIKIAQTLKISEDTVKCHVKALFKIYNVKNRTQLALLDEKPL
jgi:DNA-binding CsgD family transcriptional regulator